MHKDCTQNGGALGSICTNVDLTKYDNTTMKESDLIFKLRLTQAISAPINAILHTVGVYLLCKIDVRIVRTTQQTLLLCLSVCNALCNYLICSYTIFKFVPSSDDNIVFKLMEYVPIAMAGVIFMIYMILVMMTFDRLLTVTFTFKYMKYWNLRKTMTALKVIFCVAFAKSIGIAIAFGCVGFRWQKYLNTYVYPLLALLFLILITFSYPYMFYSFSKSQRSKRRRQKIELSTVTGKEVRKHSRTLFTIFTQSKFFVSILIILVFFSFAVVPNIYFFAKNNHKHLPSMVDRELIHIFYQIIFFADFFIYVLMQAKVRRLLCVKLRLPDIFGGTYVSNLSHLSQEAGVNHHPPTSKM